MVVLIQGQCVITKVINFALLLHPSLELALHGTWCSDGGAIVCLGVFPIAYTHKLSWARHCKFQLEKYNEGRIAHIRFVPGYYLFIPYYTSFTSLSHRSSVYVSLSLFLSVPPSFFVSLSVYLYSVDFWEKIDILQIWRCLYQIYISISVASKTADADRSINIYLRNVLYVLIQASICVH